MLLTLGGVLAAIGTPTQLPKPQRIVTPAGNRENPVPVKTAIRLLKKEQINHAKSHLLRFNIKAYSYFWQVSY